MALLVHIIFGLAIYPVAFHCYAFQNKLTCQISSGFIQDILMSPIVYYGFRVGLVISWIYFGFLLSDSVGLKFYDPEYSERLSNASDQLVSIYLFFWLCVIVGLSVKAHMEADQRLENEYKRKGSRP